MVMTTAGPAPLVSADGKTVTVGKVSLSVVDGQLRVDQAQ